MATWDRPSRRLAAIVFALSVAVCGCGSATSSASTGPTITPDPRVGLGVRSGGTIILAEVADSGVSGTLMVKPHDDGSTTLALHLSDASRPYLWRIDHQAGCAAPAVDQDAVWSFPDVEHGSQEDRIETATFLSTAGPLFVLVLPIDGPAVLACGDLGPALAAAPSTASTGCGTTGGSPALESGDIAFTLDHLANTDIYSSRLDGSDVRRLTTDPGQAFDPSWSSDGRSIAFRSTRDGHDEIYVMTWDGSCQRNLTDSDADSWSPAWSPDGRQIAFAHFFDGPSAPQDVAVMSVDGSGLRRLTTAHGEYPAWSPDGKQLAFASFRDGNYEIYIMNADGSDQRNVSRNPAYDMSPSWSPDGRLIAYDTQRDHQPPAQVGIGPEFEIHTMMTDGSGDRAITKDGLEDRFPTWLGDGRLIWAKGGTLWLAEADGTRASSLGSGTFPDARP